VAPAADRQCREFETVAGCGHPQVGSVSIVVAGRVTHETGAEGRQLDPPTVHKAERFA